jgi:hypothetical protein
MEQLSNVDSTTGSLDDILNQAQPRDFEILGKIDELDTDEFITNEDTVKTKKKTTTVAKKANKKTTNVRIDMETGKIL